MDAGNRLVHTDCENVFILVRIDLAEKLSIVRSQRIRGFVKNLLGSFSGKTDVVIALETIRILKSTVLPVCTLIKAELGFEHKSRPSVHPVCAHSGRKGLYGLVNVLKHLGHHKLT